MEFSAIFRVLSYIPSHVLSHSPLGPMRISTILLYFYGVKDIPQKILEIE